MEQVAKAAESGRYLRSYAKIILALAARRENQTALAQRLFRELKEEHPNSVLVCYSLRNMSRSRPLATD